MGPPTPHDLGLLLEPLEARPQTSTANLASLPVIFATL